MRSYYLRARLIASLVALVALVLVSASAALGTALACGRAMTSAHRYESAARKAASLGRLAREQYIHEAHTILLGDHSHLDHHDAWVHRFQAEAEAFRADLPEDAARRVDEILTSSRELARVFADAIVPAVSRNDHAAVAAAHAQANALVDDMTSHADALADALEQRALAAEHDAEATSGWMRWTAIVSCALALVFAFGVARRIWTGFSQPVNVLLDVSDRVANGDRRARVGKLPAAELDRVGAAFDAMLDALAAQQAALVAAERFAALGRVAAGVAHEINNPIMVIRGYASQLRGLPRAELVRDELAIIDEEAAICQRIADDLLAYTRAPALELEDIDARTLAEDVRAKCRVETRGDQDIRLDVEAAVLRVDPIRLRQVLVNLVRNGLHVDAAGVEIQGEARGDRYVFRVSDNGPGIAASAREHLFEPFYTTKADGSGLGLSVSFGLVAAHGGSIHAEDRPGGGTTMVVDLPEVVARAGGDDG